MSPLQQIKSSAPRFFGEPSTAIMRTLPWLLIPGFLVPLLFAVRTGIFVRLAASAWNEPKQPAES